MTWLPPTVSRVIGTAREAGPGRLLTDGTTTELARGRFQFELLPRGIAAVVRGRVPILIDGGIRRGSDAFKALALGASMVCVGRPYAWGLGAFGEDGVAAALRLLDEELVQTMRQCGVTSIAGLTKGSLVRLG